MDWMRSTVFTVVIGLGGLASAVSAQDADDTLARIGYIDELAGDRSSLIIEGIRYYPTLDVVVQVGGSHGSLAMLQPGMKVLYRIRPSGDGPREVVEVRQIPPGASIEGHRS